MCLGSWWRGSGVGRLRLWVLLSQYCLLFFALPLTYFRDELKRHYNLGEYWIEVEMEDLASFDEELADYLYKQPAEHLQLVSGTLAPEPPGLVLLWSLTACPLPVSSWRKLPRRWLTR